MVGIESLYNIIKNLKKNIYIYIFFFSPRQFIPCTEVGMAVTAVMETKPKDIIPQFTAIPQQEGWGKGGGG